MGVTATMFPAQDPALATLAQQAVASALEPHQLEHEIDWVVASDHGQRASAGVLGLFDDGRLAGYVPFRYRADGLLFRFASIRLGRLPYRTVELFGAGIVANHEAMIGEALMRLDAVPWPFHAVAVHEVPTASPLWRAIVSGAAPGFRTIERERGVRHVVDLPASFDAYMARFSAKTRSTSKRKARKLEADGPLTLRVYTRPEEVVPLLDTIEPVFRLTYHYHLLGRNLSACNLQLVHNLTSWAHHGWLRAYVLCAGERPLAYVIGSLSRGRYSYDMPGYDPRLAASSPGIVLLLRMIEELIGAGATLLDFGAGHADYKQLLATRSFPETSALLVRRTVYAQGVAYFQRGLATGARAGSRLLDRYQLKSRMKNWLRRRRLRPV
jgi:CelD/BcsL family acetyltransferase involved in cellulose biosynthesis